MKLIQAMGAALIAVLIGCVPEPGLQEGRGDIPDADREIFVLNGLAETISIIHPDRLALGTEEEETYLFHNVVFTGGAPNHLLFLQDTLYLVNSTSNTLGVFDESSLEKQFELYLGKKRNPWQVIPAAGGTAMYIPCYADGTILKMDFPPSAGDEPTVAASDLSLPEGGGVCADDSGREYLFVANSNNDGNTLLEGFVTVIDTALGEVLKTISIEPAGFDPTTDRGSNPQAVLVFQDLYEVHVVCTGEHPGPGREDDDGEIVVIDVNTLAVTHRIPIGGSPNAFPAGIDTDGKRVFLANNGYGITVYNYETRDVLRGTGTDTEDPLIPKNAGAGTYLTAVLYDPGTGYLFVSDFGADKIHVLNAADPDYGTVATLQASDGPGFMLLAEE